MYLLAKGWDIEDVKRVMQQNIAGELSRNHYQISIESKNNINAYSMKVPGEIDFDKLINAYSFPDSIDLTKNYLQKYLNLIPIY